MPFPTDDNGDAWTQILRSDARRTTSKRPTEIHRNLIQQRRVSAPILPIVCRQLMYNGRRA